MELKEERVQTLQLLGLTLCQAKIYLALARLGISKTKTISKVAGVGQQDVYRIMPKLCGLGLVEKAVSIPVMFKAVPIKDAVSILVELRKKEFKKVQAKSIELLRGFRKNEVRIAVPRDAPQFLIIPQQEILREGIRQFENARMSIDVVTSWKKLLRWVSISIELYKEALKRGVKMRSITDKPEDVKSLPNVLQDLKKNQHFKIKYVPVSPRASMALYDNKVAYVNTSSTAGLAETPCYCTNNPSLLAIFQSYFEILWLTTIEEMPQENFSST